MLKRFVVILLSVFWTGGVFAQDTPPLGPIGSFTAGDFRALAVTVSGERLLVADAENQQVRVYDFAAPAEPSLLSLLDLSGTPVLLAGGEDYGLVAVVTEAATDILEAVAPALPDPGAEYLSGWANIDIGKNPRALALSPDSHWGVAVSDSGFTLLQINGVGDISSIPVDEPVLDAALSNSVAYMLGPDSLHTIPLGDLFAIQIDQTIPLDGTPSVLALNPDISQGVFVVDGNRLVFFDPAALETTGEFVLDGQPITSVHFLNSDGAQYLVVTQQDSANITVLNAADPQNIAVIDGTLVLDKPVIALAVFGQYMVATDGVTIRIFST